MAPNHEFAKGYFRAKAGFGGMPQSLSEAHGEAEANRETKAWSAGGGGGGDVGIGHPLGWLAFILLGCAYIHFHDRLKPNAPRSPPRVSSVGFIALKQQTRFQTPGHSSCVVNVGVKLPHFGLLPQKSGATDAVVDISRVCPEYRGEKIYASNVVTTK